MSYRQQLDVLDEIDTPAGQSWQLDQIHEDVRAIRNWISQLGWMAIGASATGVLWFLFIVYAWAAAG